MERAFAVHNPPIDLHVLEGGILPKRMTEGAIGYDVSLRAIVSATEKDPDRPYLRKTLFDFVNAPGCADVERHVKHVSREDDTQGEEYVYVMEPGESLLGGIGFLTDMPFPLMYWVAPRSGLAAKHGITVTNAPGTVDPDYRGEAGVLIYNRNSTPYILRRNMRIAQIVFMWAVIPEFRLVASAADLGATKRGAGGFGSTGITQ